MPHVSSMTLGLKATQERACRLEAQWRERKWTWRPGAQELRPGWPGPPWRGVDPGIVQNLPCCRCRYLHTQAGQLAADPAVAPFGVLPGQPQDQSLDVPAGRRPAGLSVHGPRGPAAGGDVAVPAQDRVRGDQQPQPLGGALWVSRRAGSPAGPGPPSSRPGGALPLLHHGELVAQDQDLCGLPCLLTPGTAAAMRPPA